MQFNENAPEMDVKRYSNTHNHGQRTSNEAFCHQNPKLLGLGRQFGQIKFEVFGVFLADLSSPILVQ
jgi:hypothetical protein